MDPRSLFDHLGGMTWGVVLTLLVMSVASIGIMFERWWTFREAARHTRRGAPELARLLGQGLLVEAAERCRRGDVQRSHVARALEAGLREWQDQAARPTDSETAADAAKQALSHASALLVADLRRGLSMLATIGSTAPFVGLFGTTLGIINAFSGMATGGATGFAVVSAGIAEALITTAFGLFVAVPAVWAYNFFLGRVEAVSVELDHAAYQILGRLRRLAA